MLSRLGVELDEHQGVRELAGWFRSAPARQLRNVIAEDDIVAAQEIARIDEGRLLQGDFLAVAQNLDPIGDHPRWRAARTCTSAAAPNSTIFGVRAQSPASAAAGS